MNKLKDVIFLDLETTGLDTDDEFVSIAIIDSEDNILLDTLSKPVKKLYWQDAQRIHKISPDAVKNSPTNAELEKTIVDICKGKTIVIYNAEFIQTYLPSEAKANKIYGLDDYFYEYCECDYDPYNSYCRTLKLKEACARYDYKLLKPHNALHDVKATKYLYLGHLERLENGYIKEAERLNTLSLDKLIEEANEFFDDLLEDERDQQKKIDKSRHKAILKNIYHSFLNTTLPDRVFDHRDKYRIEIKFNNNIENILAEAKLFYLPVITDRRKLNNYMAITAYQEEEKNAELELYEAVYLPKNKKHIVLLYKVKAKKNKIIPGEEYNWWTNVHVDLTTKTILKTNYKIPSKTLNKLKSVAKVSVSRGNYGRRGYNEYDLYNLFDAINQ